MPSDIVHLLKYILVLYPELTPLYSLAQCGASVYLVYVPLINMDYMKRWAGHVARMGEEKGVYRVLVGKPEGKRPLGRPRRRWVDNISMDLQEVGCGYTDGIGLAQDRDTWRTLVSAVMYLRVLWISWLAAHQLASQEGLCTME